MSTSFFENFKQWSFENLPEKIINALPSIIGFLLIIIIGFWLSGVVGKLLVKIMERRNVDKSIHRFMQRSVTIFLRIIVSVIALEQIGISVNSFITAIGAAGITAGLGLQNSISQFASGIQILFNKPFKAGDFIEIGDVQGKVKEIRFMFTTLVTLDNKVVVVPNQTITTKYLINYTAQDMLRIDLTYCISYNDDIEKAKEVLSNVVTSSPNILKTPKPIIGVSEHAASGINLAVFGYCKNDNYWPTYFQMQEDVKLAFDKNNIHIPFNQMDVHIVKE
jgi:small conductance mechanosensitive channel